MNGMNTTTKAIVGIVMAVVVLYGGYRIYHHVTYKTPAAMPITSAMPQASRSPQAMANSVYKMMAMKAPASGNYLTDEKGMTLYTSNKDTAGVSNCTGTCITNWPAYGPKTMTAQNTWPTGVTVITRSDGTFQYALNGMPLYYWIQDKAPGDTTGNGVNGFTVAVAK